MVDRNRIEGTVRSMGGKIQAGVGSIVGDPELEAEGEANQVTGSLQDAFGSALDYAAVLGEDLAAAATAKPLTALAIAIVTGFLVRVVTHSPSRQ